tara:strand:- start:267 stop:998 length:732 start_codon:yes stop_codon:yes gene_type:complete
MCIPFFVVLTPLLLTISIVTIYYFKDQIIKENVLRQYVNNLPYEKWFGDIENVPLPSFPSLICLHPHGIICTGILFSTHFRPQSCTVIAVSKWLFLIPFVGWVARHLGCIPATYHDILLALKTTSVILVPGGVPELVTGKLYTKRYGFLKIAKKANVPILPVVVKEEYYNRIPCPFVSFREKIAIYVGLPIMLPVIGYYGTWLPKRIPIQPKVLEQIKIKDSIEAEHDQYFAELSKIVKVLYK